MESLNHDVRRRDLSVTAIDSGRFSTNSNDSSSSSQRIVRRTIEERDNVVGLRVVTPIAAHKGEPIRGRGSRPGAYYRYGRPMGDTPSWSIQNEEQEQEVDDTQLPEEEQDDLYPLDENGMPIMTPLEATLAPSTRTRSANSLGSSEHQHPRSPYSTSSSIQQYPPYTTGTTGQYPQGGHQNHQEINNGRDSRESRQNSARSINSNGSWRSTTSQQSRPRQHQTSLASSQRSLQQQQQQQPIYQRVPPSSSLHYSSDSQQQQEQFFQAEWQELEHDDSSPHLPHENEDHATTDECVCEPASSKDTRNKVAARKKKNRWVFTAIALIIVVLGIVVGVVSAVLINGGGGSDNGNEGTEPPQPELCRFDRRLNNNLEHRTICRDDNEVLIPLCAVMAYQDLLESFVPLSYPELYESITTRRGISGLDPFNTIRTSPCNYENLALVHMAMALATNPNIRRLDYFLLSMFHLSILDDGASTQNSSRDGSISVFSGPWWKDNDEYSGEWLSPFTNPCSWFGVGCGTDNNEVLSLDVTASSIVSGIGVSRNDMAIGSLPTEICFLTNLEIFVMERGPIAGPIPSEIGTCPKLKALAFVGNRLTGSIPTEIGSLTTLSRLRLQELGEITGTLPSELGLLSSLTSLHVESMFLDPAPIPSEFFGLTNLGVLLLEQLELTGMIPSEIVNLEKLEQLSLPSNELSGPIPTEVGYLTNLAGFWVEFNDLTGTVVSEFGKCTLLKILSFSNNLLDGVLPTELGLLTKLTQLSLDKNSITGTTPEEICSLISTNAVSIIANFCSPSIVASCITNTCF